jgi:pyruvate/2-oxoglutarate/acetoin dehydrogenase E1 component
LGLGWMTNNPRAPGVVPEEPYEVPIGKLGMAREGTDLSIATVGLSVHRALDAAEALEENGISAEVLDLRSLVPLDREGIVASVQKTGRLMVVDEDYHSFGMSGEVVATAIEGAFDYLDAPPVRVTTPDIPIPYSRPLEQWALPSVDRIVEAASTLLVESG